MIPTAEKVLEDLAEKIAAEKPWEIIISFEPDDETIGIEGNFRYYFSPGGDTKRLIVEEEPQKFGYNYSQIKERVDRLSNLMGDYELCDFIIIDCPIERSAAIVLSS